MCYLACNKSSLEFIDKLIIPFDMWSPSRFGGIQCPSILGRDNQCLGSIKDDTSLRFAQNIVTFSPDNNKNSEEESNQRQQIRRPETHFVFHQGGQDGPERSNINGEVEIHVDSLCGHSRVDYDQFFANALEIASCAGTLFCNQCTDVRLDTFGQVL